MEHEFKRTISKAEEFVMKERLKLLIVEFLPVIPAEIAVAIASDFAEQLAVEEHRCVESMFVADSMAHPAPPVRATGKGVTTHELPSGQLVDGMENMARPLTIKDVKKMGKRKAVKSKRKKR